MRLLQGILGILIIILIAALIYEFVLGNAEKETGSQRMNGTEQETALPAGQTGWLADWSAGDFGGALSDFEIV